MNLRKDMNWGALKSLEKCNTWKMNSGYLINTKLTFSIVSKEMIKEKREQICLWGPPMHMLKNFLNYCPIFDNSHRLLMSHYWI